MILTIDRNTLLTAMTKIGGIVGRKSTIPILSNVLLTAGENGLTIQATNLDMEATVTAKAQVDAPGQTCVPADTLMSIAKNASEGADIRFELKDRLQIRSGRSNYKLATLPPVDFPTFPAMDDGQSVDLSGAELGRLFRSSFAQGVDAGRQYLCGVYLYVRDGELIALATDGLRLAMGKIPDTMNDFSAIVPTAMVAEIARFVSEGAVNLLVSPTKIRVSTEDTIVVGKLIDYTFSDYRRVFPTNADAVVTVDADGLLCALRRVAVAVEDKSNSARLVIENGTMTVSARVSEIDATDELECQYEGEPLNVGINCVHILDAVSALNSDTVELCFSPKKGPMLVRAPGDGSLISTIMPLKV